ncbi:ATP-binding protein [Thaumasiovibrio subtropicus]|uniref:ATP-binding protein n=1 Tax=Thaumasiovibrio subtropicus TaxID=1891207 RepID=UPI000B34B7B7|nr:ATP-binding protein [Thaumasiovibrio subtropicus]
MEHHQGLDRIIAVYFSNSKRTQRVSSGEIVLEQDGENDRLFWVKKGQLSGHLRDDATNVSAEVFTVSEGMFFGVHSFFARTGTASTTVITDKDSEIAWIDFDTPAEDVASYGSLSEQFMPVIVHELSRRQVQAGLQAFAKKQAMESLYAAEQMSTLGQLAAGIAHELNNAVGVLSSKTESMVDDLAKLIAESHPEGVAFFDSGVVSGQSSTSSEVRTRAKALQTDFRLERETAKQLARAVPEGEVPDAWLTQLPDSLHYWSMGRDLHDMRLAAKHAASIVRSVKQLGGTDQQRLPGVDINDTVNKSLSLLQSNLRRVNVVLRPAVLPTITASSTELVQVWVNIIKNACDAMEDTEEPHLEIITRHSNNRLAITISNNGPMMDEATRRKIFQPNYTTKKGGLSFGLGLGLSIVQRIVNSYGGTIATKSSPDKTTFRIKLPIR